MEGVSKTVYDGLRGYWRRKGYEKLNGRSRRGVSRSELDSTTATTGGRTRRRLGLRWRIKIKRKLKIPRLPYFCSPKKFFIWLRDAYVKMMMGFADSRVCAAASGGSNFGFGKAPLKEYDEKVIVEIYKSVVMAQGQLVPRDAAKLASHIVSPTSLIKLNPITE